MCNYIVLTDFSKGWSLWGIVLIYRKKCRFKLKSCNTYIYTHTNVDKKKKKKHIMHSCWPALLALSKKRKSASECQVRSFPAKRSALVLLDQPHTCVTMFAMGVLSFHIGLELLLLRLNFLIYLHNVTLMLCVFSVPLLSRVCPSDVCRIWKSGASLRVDATLLGFENMTWIRGQRSYIFRGDGACLCPHRTRWFLCSVS